MEDGDGDSSLENGSVHDLTRDTYFYLRKGRIEVETGEGDRKKYKVRGLGATQVVSENGRP